MLLEGAHATSGIVEAMARRLVAVDFLRLVLLSVALSFAVSGHAQQAAVATAHPLATDAGMEVLAKGGNAFDAAVAVTATLAVVEPYSSGIGGGGFWLLHIKRDQRDIMLDGRERAPLAATRDMYLDKNGDVVPGASINGPLSAGIPGVPAAMVHLSSHYGSLPLSITLAPAIKHASEGFTTDEHYQRMASVREQALNASADAARIFLKNKKAPEPGSRIIQADLADTLKVIAAEGVRGFYQGAVAERMVESVVSHGGIWSMQDLASYRVVEREPIRAVYKGMQVVSAAPPSSGGIALVQMLNMLSTFNYSALSESQRVHVLAEVMRRAYRDRAEFLGDTDFVDVPVRRLTSSKHAKKLADNIQLDAVTSSASLTPVTIDSPKASDTTHFSIIDGEGNRVSATLSINYPFGSGFVATGTGVLLNDEMDDFSSKPGEPNVYGLVGAEANAIEPGKRMLSSMTPTFLETSDRIAVLGTPGGSRIITMVLLGALAFHGGGNAEDIVDRGRFHHQYLPDKLFAEPDVFPEQLLDTLSEFGHDIEIMDSDYGNMHVIVQHKKNGRLDAAADRRGGGKARVVP